jgi:hypothetical protein
MQDYDATYLVTKFPGVSATILIDQVKDHVCCFLKNKPVNDYKIYNYSCWYQLQFNF